MGAASSQHFSTIVESWSNPEGVPKVTDKPSNDPLYGFNKEREERGLILFYLEFF